MTTAFGFEGVHSFSWNAPLVRCDEDRGIVFCRLHNGTFSCPYAVDPRDIRTRRGLIRCIRHLSDKETWITLQHIRELIDLSFQLAGKHPFTEETL